MNYQGRALRYGSALSGGYQPYEPSDILEDYNNRKIGIREAGKLLNYWMNTQVRLNKSTKEEASNYKDDQLEEWRRSGLPEELYVYMFNKRNKGKALAAQYSDKLVAARAKKSASYVPRKKYRYTTDADGVRYRCVEAPLKSQREQKPRKPRAPRRKKPMVDEVIPMEDVSGQGMRRRRGAALSGGRRRKGASLSGGKKLSLLKR